MRKGNKPLYMEIIDYLKGKIHENELQPEDKLPTEADLAEKFDVSRITSNRALVELEREGLIYRVRGSGSFVAPKEDESNIVNVKTNKIIGLVLPFESFRGGVVDTIQGATEFLGEHGYYLSVHSAKESHEKEKNIIEKLVNEGFLGVIYYPNFNNKNLDLINRLYVENYPIVTIDKYYDSIPISYVISDNFEGGYLATEHLINLNHKNISFVSGIEMEERMSIRDRYFGYFKALNENDIKINSEIHRFVYNSELNGKMDVFNSEHTEKIRKIISDLIDNGVTAIVAENDYLAIVLQRVCGLMDINVPQEMSIVGFDNLDLSDKVNLPLTTVEQNFHKIGQKAAEILIKSIENNKYNYDQVEQPVELIKRKSTAECKTKNS